MTVKIAQTVSHHRKRKYHISFPTVLRTAKEVLPKQKRKKVINDNTTLYQNCIFSHY